MPGPKRGNRQETENHRDDVLSSLSNARSAAGMVEDGIFDIPENKPAKDAWAKVQEELGALETRIARLTF